jgi:hypothetical protein
MGHQGPHFAVCRLVCVTLPSSPSAGLSFLLKQFSERRVSLIVGVYSSNEAQHETRSICYRSFFPSPNCRCCRRSRDSARQSWQRDRRLFETSLAELLPVLPPQRRSSTHCSHSNGEPSLTRNDCYPLSFAFANEPLERTVMKKVVLGTLLIALATSTAAFAQGGAATGAATGAVDRRRSRRQHC